MKSTLFERIMRSTLRLDVIGSNVQPVRATGFLFDTRRDGDTFAPYLITCKHALRTVKEIKFPLTVKNPDGASSRILQQRVHTRMEDIILHPHPAVDLAAISLKTTFSELESSNIEPICTFLDYSCIPLSEEWDTFNAIERVVMLGYPYGLCDEANNLPLIRCGTTATHPCFDYQGIPKFLADMACYDGSSGSPVFLCDQDFKLKPPATDGQVMLLGIQASGFRMSSADMETCLHLGTIVKSSQISVLFSKLDKSP